MTPTERAEKIVACMNGACCCAEHKDIMQMIATQIEEAERELIARELPKYKRGLKDSYIAGFAAARERAKGIVSKDISSGRSNGYGWVSDRLEHLAKRIAAMQPEGK